MLYTYSFYYLLYDFQPPVKLKGTVSVILSDLSCKDGNVQIPIPFSDQYCKIYIYFFI